MVAYNVKNGRYKYTWEWIGTSSGLYIIAIVTWSNIYILIMKSSFYFKRKKTLKNHRKPYVEITKGSPRNLKPSVFLGI